jgi:hypothetical protein
MAPNTKSSNIEFTCTEISGLWTIYFQEGMAKCFLTHFLQHVRDEEIKKITEESLKIAETRLESIRAFFEEEGFPIPGGYTEADVNNAAPPLFHDPFALSFVYMMNRLSVINLGFITTNNVRLDVLEFFSDCSRTAIDMLGKAVQLSLSKGIYDRPPKMNYPKEIEFVKKESFISGFLGHKRPLSAIELSEIFFNIERNYFSVLLTLGFAQVVKDKKLKEFILEGKAISEKQIAFFNKLLQDEDLLGTVSVSMEVTESTISPFSDKLIMSMIGLLNPVDITLISHALSVSMRTDLIAEYTKLIGEIMLYSKETFDILIDRQWMEQPPLATNRSTLIHS